MQCPNCSETMQLVTLDNQNVLHCPNCGGSYFEENGINRITFGTAQKLAEEKQNEEVYGTEKHCPKDKSVMTPIRHEESIPEDVTLLRCPTCQGIFAFPDDLIHFKEAQEAKVNYFKIWNIPLPALRAVVVLSFIVLAGAIFAQYIFFQRNALSPSQASEILKKVYVSSKGNYLFLSFQTQIPIRSHIKFYDKTSKQNIPEKVISDKPVTIHIATINDLTLTDDISYKIILIDATGKRTELREVKLILK